MALSVLFIGGTGQISLPCVEKAVAAGHKVTVFNRGVREDDPLPRKVKTIAGDMKDEKAYRKLGKTKWDVVAQFMVFTPEQMKQDIDVFTGRTGQYIFISSASVYEKLPKHYVITEKTPAINPFWPYSQNKIACEELVQGSKNLPWTIVRPSHTVRSGMPTMVNEGDIIPQRMLQGKPILVAGDGATPWTLTRSEDFAKPYIGLFGKPKAMSEIFHITSDRGHTWDEIYTAIGRGLGVEARIVHVPTDTLVRYKKDWDGPLWGDKTWTALFDNSKVKSVAGDFTCVEDIDGILEQSIRHFKKRQAEKGPVTSELEPLYDRIAREQSALGA
jgi:nucleoside-diphosphate-sugar epimerase